MLTAPPPVPIIDPRGIYDDSLLWAILALNSRTLADARRAGELRFTRKGQRRFYLGQWVLDWLAGSAPAGNGPAGEDHGPEHVR
jgi:hypothetical protein